MRLALAFTVFLISAVLNGCASLTTEQAEEVVLPYVTNFSYSQPEDDVPKGWQPWTLSKFKKPTAYKLVTEDGKTVIKASASSSASGLLHPLNLDPARYPLLQWRWKVNELIARADNTRKDTEDSPVRVVISFDGDLDNLSFDDRIFFDQIKAITGQQLPYATLMYIWENRVPKGNVIPNRHTSRIKMVVAESGRDKVGSWQEQSRNVYEDFRRAFGERPGRIISIGIMTDTDNTGDNVHAYYGDIIFKRVAPPRHVFASD
jgi:DUF3047 family protein